MRRSLWLDTSRVPNTRSVHSFIDSLGLRRSPMAEHLVERMLFIAEKYLPTEDAKRASGEAFYVLCDRFDEWKEQSFFQDAINSLQKVGVLPRD
jgi:thymidylate kinase